MLSNLPGVLNVALCTVIVLTLFFYRRRDSRHKPLMSWLPELEELAAAMAQAQVDRNDEIYRRQREMKEELNNLDDLRSIRAFDVTQ